MSAETESKIETGVLPDDGRQLFRYLNAEEWATYRAIMDCFAGTFFSEFAPADIRLRLSEQGLMLDEQTVADRLERLRRWGNLAVSSSVGNPTSLEDYYRRRNRYLITQAGQEVHQVVEQLLRRVDDVRDVSTGRLRSLDLALTRLAGADVEKLDPTELGDLVRAVFDPHEAFTSEISQFFAAINQWQSRYDLSTEEFAFFREVLIGYVAERLDEIERAARPIARHLADLEPRIPGIVERARHGLADRLDDAGLDTTVSVQRAAGSRVDDWDHLTTWFRARDGRSARIEQLTWEALAAVRTLTLNLTRLSRAGHTASSRRSDLLRLARLFDQAGDEIHTVAAAAMGLHGSLHLGVLAFDAEDPVSPATSWWDAPRAEVPISLRQRASTTNTGRPSSIPDRAQERELIRLRRQAQADARARVDHELIAADLAHDVLSDQALHRLEELLAGALRSLSPSLARCSYADGSVELVAERSLGARTSIRTEHGVLSIDALTVVVRASAGSDRGPAVEASTDA